AGGRWQADKGGGKVSTAAVQDTLDALAGLQAERYVADRGADLKLYGLQPPQLVLEAQTPAGQRLLPRGRHGGGAKRYYARVPEGENASAVFVISEADAARLVRPLQAFLERPTKTAASP